MEAGGAPRPDPPPLRRTRFTELLPAVGSFDPQNTAEQMRFPSVRRERLRGTEGTKLTKWQDTDSDPGLWTLNSLQFSRNQSMARTHSTLP